MGTKNPEDPKIRLARAEERLKNSTQLKRQVEVLAEELKNIARERNQFHEELEIEKKKSEFLEIALDESKSKLVARHKYNLKLSFFNDIFFLIANILTCWGVNDLSSTPRNDTGFILIGAGAIIFIINSISSKVLASGGDIQ